MWEPERHSDFTGEITFNLGIGGPVRVQKQGGTKKNVSVERAGVIFH